VTQGTHRPRRQGTILVLAIKTSFLLSGRRVVIHLGFAQRLALLLLFRGRGASFVDRLAGAVAVAVVIGDSAVGAYRITISRGERVKNNRGNGGS